MNRNQLAAAIESFPQWHYQFDLDGLKTPVADPSKINRHLQRKAYFFDPLVKLCGGSLAGKRVLDLGCNAGYWALRAIEAGCEFVLGIEREPMYIDQAKLVFAAKGVPDDRYRFVQADIFEYDLAAEPAFDVVLLLGVLDRVDRPIELIRKAAAANRDLLIIDTSIVTDADTVFRLAAETPGSAPSALPAEFALQPSMSAVTRLCHAAGYHGAVLRPNFPDYSGAEDYRQGSRRAFIAAKHAVLRSLAPVAEQRFGAPKSGRFDAEPDSAGSARTGAFGGDLDQWFELVCRSWENPSALPPEVRLPGFPSEQLQTNTTGRSGRATLLEAFHFYRACLAAFQQTGAPIGSGSKVLDFACGWGRIARLFLHDVELGDLYGGDISAEFTAICRETFQSPNFLANEAYPPTQFSDGFFSHIVGFSIFSHLSEAAARAWIKEFWRLLAPGGMLVLTTRSRAFLDYCESMRRTEGGAYQKALGRVFDDFAQARQRYDAGHFVHSNQFGLGGGGKMTREFYGESFIPEAYAAREYAEFFELADFLPALPGSFQAMLVFRKRDAAGAESFQGPPELRLRPRVLDLPPVPFNLLMNPHAHEVLADFRWQDYLERYPDLAARLPNEEAARKHFIYSGYIEGRLHSNRLARFVNGEFYRDRYPQLNLKSDAAAQLHYCHAGYYERLIPNADTQWLCDADLHIFQSGKVGSNSIARAIAGGYDGGALHLHWLTDIATAYPQCPLSYREIFLREKKRRLRVISGVREIVSRVLAGHLQYLDTIEKADVAAMGAEKVLAQIGVSFWTDAAVILNWFDHQYFSGLDIYATPFDHAAGHVRIEHERFSLLVYRQEDLARMDGPLGAFLSIDNFSLGHENAAQAKGYAEAYAALQARLVVPEDVLSQLYRSRYMTHFYSEEERARFFEHWRKPRV